MASALVLRRGLRAACSSAAAASGQPAGVAASARRLAVAPPCSQHHWGPLRSSSSSRSSSTQQCRSSRGIPHGASSSPAVVPASSGAPQGRQVLAHFQAELCTPRAASTVAYTEPRVRVAVDVDEVLGQFVLALNQFCEARYAMKHDVSQYWVYEFAKIWGCDQDRSHHIVHEFFKSPQFTSGIPVIPGAHQSLTRLSKQHDLLVVTSRQHVIQDQTLSWLDQHFAGLFKDVYFGNHWSLEGVSRKKSDICRTIGAGLLVDDNPLYAWDCSQAGVHVLLFDWNLGYPWSKLKDSQQHPLIRVVRDWHEVEEALQDLEPELRAKMTASNTAATAATTAATAAGLLVNQERPHPQPR